ncbi:hypothetical protein JTE90_016091 [Oedothorax gibbosus]|uniref:Uncharacterized protein n=1 Tax=Oedothorax gibbosus TaxID=931172 RepID=A0AAV6TSI3_9ARAC|nr:hypothetical protein JTE90_016091 [Oedothorax gibbosus]
MTVYVPTSFSLRDHKKLSFSISQSLTRTGTKPSKKPATKKHRNTPPPANDAVLRKFTNKRYVNKLRKLCVSDAINHSRQIFQKHVIGYIPQEARLHQQNAILANNEPDNIRDCDIDYPTR